MKNKPNAKINYIYSMSYSILATVLPLITSPYISRVIGSSGLGIYSYNYTMVTYFMQFASLGIGFYGNRSIAKVRDNRDKLNKVFSEIFFMQLVTSMTMICLYIIYVLAFVKENKIIALIMLLYVITPAFSISWFFNGMENFKITVIRNFCIKILTVISIFLFIKDPNDLWLYVLIMALGYFFSEGYLILIVHKYVSFHMPKIKNVIPHFKPNIVLFIPIFAVSIYRSMDKLMLKWIVNYSEVGYYSNAEKIINVLLSAITSLGQVMLPKMTYILSTGNEKDFILLNRKSLKYATIISSAMACGIVGVSENFVPIFFGPGYNKCVPILKMLGINLILLSWGNTLKAEYLIPKEKDSLYIKAVGVGAIVNLIVNFTLIPSLQSIGAVIGTLSAEMVSLVIIIYGINKEFSFSSVFRENIPYLVIGIIMLIVVKFVGSIQTNHLFLLIMQVLSGIFVYCFILIIYVYLSNDPIKFEIHTYIDKIKKLMHIIS